MILFFMIKHFICDFPLQAYPYMYKNKGTYGHTGGILHAGIHGVGTLIILVCFITNPWLILGWALFDTVTHYHIDFAKMWLTKRYYLTPNNCEFFWILLGFDQLLHFITYYIIWICVS